MTKWKVKLEPEEKKFLEDLAIEHIDKSMSKVQYGQHICTLNNMTFQTWGLGKYKTAMAAIRKELGIVAKKGGFVPIAGRKKTKTIGYEAELQKLFDVFSCKLRKLIKKQMKDKSGEAEQLRTQLKEKTDLLRDLREVRQAVERYHGK